MKHRGKIFGKGRLFVRITILVCLLIVFVVSINTVLSIRSKSGILMKGLIEKNKLFALLLSNSTKSAFRSADWYSVEHLVRRSAESEEVIYCKVVKPDGEIFLANDRSLYGKKIDDTYLLDTEELTVKDTILPQTGEKVKLIINPVEIGRDRWSVWVAVSLRPINRAKMGILYRNLVEGALIIVMGVFITFLLSRSITNPIAKLVEGTRKVSGGNLEYQANIATHDEVGKLAEAFNQMTKDLKRARDEGKGLQENLEQMVEDRTRELKETQKELVNKAIEAGRAQLSAMVLHNIGNAVTPIKVYMEGMKASDLEKITHYFEKCYLDLKEHAGNLQHYINNDPRGKEVFSYMGKLVDSLKDREKQKKAEIEKIDTAVSYISEILSLQHSYAAREQETKERTDLNSLIEDATRMQAGALEKRGISVKKDFDPDLPKLLIDKNRLMQVMVNLIKNSYEAIDELKDGSKERVISIKSFAEDGDVGFEITDNGIGIEPEDMEAVFEFGKSRKGSPGFGLYYCKMFVEANKGRLHIRSPGRGKGATGRVMFET